MNIIRALKFILRASADPTKGFTLKEAIELECRRRNASSVDVYILGYVLCRDEFPPESLVNAFKRNQINLM